MQIDIGFETFKALTALRPTEKTSFDDVILALLDLSGLRPPPLVATSDGASLVAFAPGGRALPDGTQLAARYKGKPYSAEIADGRVVSAGGRSFKSLSAAARDITGNSVNGLTFWKAKRPGDSEWTIVAGFPKIGRNQ